MRLALAPWGETLREQVDAAVAGEAAGFESNWTSELQRTAYVPAAAIAGATRRAGVGTAIALAFTRSPLTTALTALDLDELSGGRFMLGLGSGVRRLNEDWHGAAFEHPADRLRETVAAIRLVVGAAGRGEPIEFEGEHVRLHIRGWERPFPAARTSIPVYIAAVGPHMLRLAGEVADGWISHELCSPAYLRERALPGLDAGLARAGRARESLQVVASAVCCVDEDRQRAFRRAAALVAFYASVRSYEDFFDFHGFLPQARAIRERFRAGDTAGMAALCPDEMVAALALVGTADEVRARLCEYAGLADVVKVSPPTHGLSAAATRAAQAAILDVFGRAG